MAAILLFLVITTCLYTKKPFSKQRMRNVLCGIYGLYPGGFLREYAKINIRSFLCYMQNETELTQT